MAARKGKEFRTIKIIRVIKTAWNAVLNMLFPPIQIKNAVINQTMFCSICRARLPENKKICHKNSSYKLAAASEYDGDVKKYIWELKYRGRIGAVQPLADLMKSYLSNLTNWSYKSYKIIPVPLYPDREKERGYNQATFIAREIGKFLNLPLLENFLVKIRETKPQAETENWSDRQENIKNCFTMRPIKGENIILVDDVFTSGATINEAVRTLRAAGAGKIVALVMAKVK